MLRKEALLAGAFVAVASVAVPALAEDAAPISYTTDQADHGKELFGDKCVSCHGDTLTGGVGGGPPLTGDYFFSQWGGQPLTSVSAFIKANMPQDAPGSLSDTQVAEILAYILQFNGIPSGQAELGSPDQMTGTMPTAQP